MGGPDNYSAMSSGLTDGGMLGQKQSMESDQPVMDLPKPVTQKAKQPTIYPQQQMYDASTINKQYEQEQKLMNILTEIKKQKGQATVPESQQSYIEKLFAKKKDIIKILQLSLIIVLALSIHMIIKHYLKDYLSNSDLSFERDMFVRLLYPLAIVFLLWNFKTFVK